MLVASPQARPGTIGRRTRSKQPLVDASWDELDLLGTAEYLPEAVLIEQTMVRGLERVRQFVHPG
jgi:hypothetical protein